MGEVGEISGKTADANACLSVCSVPRKKGVAFLPANAVVDPGPDVEIELPRCPSHRACFFYEIYPRVTVRARSLYHAKGTQQRASSKHRAQFVSSWYFLFSASLSVWCFIKQCIGVPKKSPTVLWPSYSA